MAIVAPDMETMNDLTELEQSALAGFQFYQDWDSGYSKQQSTRPQTLGYGLTDSPIGQAAWIIEKFYQWTDCNGDPENAISRDDLLTNVMFYWLTESATSSANLRGFQKVAIAAANPMRIFFVRAARSEPNRIGLGIHSIVQLFVVCR